MQVTKLTCEWDIGVNECLWLDPERARKDTRKALKGCGIEESMEELEEDGLVNFEEVDVIG